MKPKLLIVDLNHLIYRYGDRFFKDFITKEDALAKIDNAITIAKNFTKSEKVIIVADFHCPSRKQFYNELLNNKESSDEYKEGRIKNEKWNELNNDVKLMLSRKYSYIRAYDYEADDIITALVDKMGNKVDKYILTIDADILPLVDNDTKVLLFRQNNTEFDDINKYSLFTVENFSTKIKMLKSFRAKGINLNNFLLVKMLIGDKSDNIPRVAKHTSTNIVDFLKWSNLDKNFRWNYFLSEDEVLEELKKIILNKKEQQEALNNFKLMKMNSTLGGKRKPFEITKEMIIKTGDHTIGNTNEK